MAALKDQIAELKDELEAWRTADDAPADMVRLDRWKSALPGMAYRHVLLLMRLVDHPGRITSRDTLSKAMRRSQLATVEDANPKGADVALVQVRRLLRMMGEAGVLGKGFVLPDGGIRTHWGIGYSIASPEARAIKALIGEADA